jgi:molecular chaperone Hsp33
MRKKEPFGNSLREQLEASARDQLHHFILDFGGLRGAFVCGTRMVSEMAANHELGGAGTRTLGHAYLAVTLMSSSLKAPDKVRLSVESRGPADGLSVEANAFGEVRGYLYADRVEEPAETAGGVLTVTRYLQGAHQPFSGQVELLYGSLAENLAHYYLVSEQTPAAMSLSVHFGEEGRVDGAGGLLLQTLPEADTAVVRAIEERFRGLPSIGECLAAGAEPRELVQAWFAEFSPLFLGSRRIAFMCHCSRSRFAGYLGALPVGELEDILENGPLPLVTTCANCNTAYEHSRADIERMLRRALEGYGDETTNDRPTEAGDGR